MPNRDRTGPNGEGPMSGRKLGYCNNSNGSINTDECCRRMHKRRHCNNCCSY